MFQWLKFMAKDPASLMDYRSENAQMPDPQVDTRG